MHVPGVRHPTVYTTEFLNLWCWNPVWGSLDILMGLWDFLKTETKTQNKHLLGWKLWEIETEWPEKVEKPSFIDRKKQILSVKPCWFYLALDICSTMTPTGQSHHILSCGLDSLWLSHSILYIVLTGTFFCHMILDGAVFLSLLAWSPQFNVGPSDWENTSF